MTDRGAAAAEMVVGGRVLAPGNASGWAFVLSAPLSLWGGVDPASGVIVDPRHPQAGASLAGRILVLPAVRGSSSSSSVLAELIRGGVGPLGIVLGASDDILAVGSVVAGELYGVHCPVVVVDGPAFARLATGAAMTIGDGGRITVEGGV